MNVNGIMAALKNELLTVPGLNVYSYVPGNPDVPAAVLDFPEEVTYDSTYGRGSDTAEFPVGLIVGRVDEESARTALGGYMVSVKAAVDGNLGGVVDSARVKSASVLRLSFAGVEYLSAIFIVEVIT